MTVPRELVEELTEIGRDLHARGWLLATSGNLSAVVSRDPLRLAITSSGANKGRLGPAAFLLIDENTNVVGDGPGRMPSEEARLHVEIVRSRGASAVLHTHSVWSTVLSERHAADGGLLIQGYEMLKGLDGVTTHDHAEWLPILENAQDMAELASRVAGELRRRPEAHGLLLRGHGLYAWGSSPSAAKRHLEALEFLLEIEGRSRSMNPRR